VIRRWPAELVARWVRGASSFWSPGGAETEEKTKTTLNGLFRVLFGLDCVWFCDFDFLVSTIGGPTTPA
jgi:hypothetical protein